MSKASDIEAYNARLRAWVIVKALGLVDGPDYFEKLSIVRDILLRDIVSINEEFEEATKRVVRLT